MVPRPIPCSVGLRPSHSVRRIGEPATVTDSRYKELEVLNNEARELEARIAENVAELLETA